MLKLQDYRTQARGLPDLLPYGAMVAPDVILNKDGSLLAAWEFRGMDRESCTGAELAYTAELANAALRGLGNGWMVHVDAIRRPEDSYQARAHCHFPDPLSRYLDEERRAWFEKQYCFHSSTYLAVTWKPEYGLAKIAGSVSGFGGSGGGAAGNVLLQALESFRQACSHLEDILAEDLIIARLGKFSYGEEGSPISDPMNGAYSELLSYLQEVITGEVQAVRVPDPAMYLDALLGGIALRGGERPRLGDGPGRWLGAVSLDGFPQASYPAMLCALDSLNLPYRFSTRFLCLDQADAEKEINMFRKGWAQKVFKLFDQIFYNPKARGNRDAMRMAEDAEQALEEVQSGDVGAGYMSSCVLLLDDDEARLGERCRDVKKLLQACGFVGRIEDRNTLEAWLGSHPGNSYANVRRPMVNTLNLAHLLPLNSIWGGIESVPNPMYPAHAPALMRCVTGATPFWMTPFADDLGHTFIVGPTGSGKSVLLTSMAMQARRYQDIKIFAFDKGMSMYAPCKGVGGSHYDIGRDLAFAPLRRQEEARDRTFAVDWLAGLISLQGMTVDPTHRNALAGAVMSLGSQPENMRTITDVWHLLQDPEGHLKAALRPYTENGEYARMFNAEEDSFGLASFTAFEMEDLMGMGDNVLIPVLLYLFHRIEQCLDGSPAILILDEAWIMLGHSLFKAKLKEWLKVLRKRNCSVWIATQSLTDAKNSGIWDVIVESCQVRILLANRSAADAGSRELYLDMGLKEEDLARIAGMKSKREYFFYHPAGKRIFDMALSRAMLAFAGASDKESLRRIKELEAQYPAKDFPWKWQEVWMEERTGEQVVL